MQIGKTKKLAVDQSKDNQSNTKYKRQHTAVFIQGQRTSNMTILQIWPRFYCHLSNRQNMENATLTQKHTQMHSFNTIVTCDPCDPGGRTVLAQRPPWMTLSTNSNTERLSSDESEHIPTMMGMCFCCQPLDSPKGGQVVRSLQNAILGDCFYFCTARTITIS